MKELRIEQKAKRYDEILAMAVGANLPYYNDAIMSKVKEFVEYLLPELKESGDERTWIINYLSNRILNSTIIAEKENLKKAIAWLEKQGEHAKFLSKIQVGDKVTRNQDGMLVNLSQLNRVAKKDEKQSEQNSARSKEDEKMLSDIVKDLVHPWNEYIPDRIEDEIKWLKNKLKSLRPQNTWKPSDDEMKALAEALSLAKNCGEEIAFDLRTLHEQLKKLRED